MSRPRKKHKHTYEEQLDVIPPAEIHRHHERIKKWRTFGKVTDKAGGSVVIPKGWPHDWDDPRNAAQGGWMHEWGPRPVFSPPEPVPPEDPHAPFRAFIEASKRDRQDPIVRGFSVESRRAYARDKKKGRL